jgi:hypothetical protein
MLLRSLAAIVVGTAALIACGGSGNSPQAMADATTKAVYENDINAMQARFDDDLKKQVTIDQIGQISSKLHSFGNYKGLEQTTLDESKGRYDFVAHFDQTVIPVHLRLDPAGRIAAFRLDIPQPISSR